MLLLVHYSNSIEEGLFSQKNFRGCWVKRDWEIQLEVKTVAPPIDIMLQEILLLALILLRGLRVSHVNQESHLLLQETICIILNFHHFYISSLSAPLQPLVSCDSWSEVLWRRVGMSNIHGTAQGSGVQVAVLNLGTEEKNALRG